MMYWMTMDSAPKNSTSILVVSDGIVRITSWEECDVHKLVVWTHGFAWFGRYDDGMTYALHGEELPSCWMPLPEVPKNLSEKS